VKKECLKHQDCNFIFVHNDKYAVTNYIVSMDNAANFLSDDFIMLHGDLVFDKKAIRRLINSKHQATCYIDKTKPLPEKDLKVALKTTNYTR
jgi:phosphoenolpyruvate phosphomutase